MDQIRAIDKRFPLKKSSLGDPKIYLGTKSQIFLLANEFEAWSIRCGQR